MLQSYNHDLICEINLATTEVDESLSKFTFNLNKQVAHEMYTVLSLLNSVIDFVPVINGFLLKFSSFPMEFVQFLLGVSTHSIENSCQWLC